MKISALSIFNIAFFIGKLQSLPKYDISHGGDADSGDHWLEKELDTDGEWVKEADVANIVNELKEALRSIAEILPASGFKIGAEQESSIEVTIKLQASIELTTTDNKTDTYIVTQVDRDGGFTLRNKIAELTDSNLIIRGRVKQPHS